MFAFVELSTRKMSELLLLYKNAKPQNSPHCWGHQKVWMNSLAASALQFWPCIIRFSSFIHFKDSLWGPHYPKEEACRMAFSSGCRGRRITFTGQECMLLLKCGRRKGT